MSLLQHVVTFLVGVLKVIISDVPDRVKLQVRVKTFKLFLIFIYHITDTEREAVGP